MSALLPIFAGRRAYRADPRRSEDAAGGSAGVRDQTAAILDRVRRGGDRALVECAREFDRVELTPERIAVSPEELAQLAAAADPEDRDLLRRASDRIAAYHDRQREASFAMDLGGGSRLEWRVLPLRAAGVYVPGGAAVYPSTVLMNTGPARVAGVPRIVLATPPGALERSPQLAAAVAVSGVSEVYRVGGAQAIAALAFGTETVRPVDVVVGPGNQWVAEAKRQVGHLVGTDSFAGPSEVVVVADGSAEAGPGPAWIASDLLAQAEHGSGEERAVLITTSHALAEAVAAEVARQAESQPNRATIVRALSRHGAAVVVGSLDEAVELAVEFAPEHLEVFTEDPEALAGRFPTAGAVLLGPHSPVAIGDYGAGPNHVLPTGGTGRFASPLSVADFTRRQSLIRYERDRLEAERGDFERFARIEGFEAHARSVSIRFADDGVAGPPPGELAPATRSTGA